MSENVSRVARAVAGVLEFLRDVAAAPDVRAARAGLEYYQAAYYLACREIMRLRNASSDHRNSSDQWNTLPDA